MGVNLNFFRSPGIQDPDFFDEGPKITIKVSGSKGGMDTSMIDAFRQGVELTQQKHFDAGMAKIHAGEPGHVLRKNNFGENKNFFPDPRYADIDLFNPIVFLTAQEHNSYLTHDIFTFPIVTGDSSQVESYNTDGVIEPLTVRATAAFYSMDAPFESHSIKGELMGGNADQSLSSDQVVTVDYFDPASQIVPYLDDVDMLGTMGVSTGFFHYDKIYTKPFDDSRYPRNVISSSRGEDMDIALSLMSGSTDNYVSFKQRSQTAGWDYDTTTAIGTDSIAFGGMTH